MLTLIVGIKDWGAWVKLCNTIMKNREFSLSCERRTMFVKKIILHKYFDRLLEKNWNCVGLGENNNYNAVENINWAGLWNIETNQVRFSLSQENDIFALIRDKLCKRMLYIGHSRMGLFKVLHRRFALKLYDY